MSATNRGAARAPNDYYRTPAYAVERLVPHLPLYGFVLDPCAGDGAILDALESHSTGGMAGFELVPELAGSARERHEIETRDAMATDPWGRPNVIVMNPPFKEAMAFVVRALAEVGPGGTVAALLRLGWLAGQARAAFHREHPADVFVLSKRPCFTGSTSDASEYGWLVWGPGRGNRWFIL